MNVIPNNAMISVITNDSKYSRVVDFGGPTGAVSAAASFSGLLINLLCCTLTASGRFQSLFGRCAVQIFKCYTCSHHLRRFYRLAMTFRLAVFPDGLDREFPGVRH